MKKLQELKNEVTRNKEKYEEESKKHVNLIYQLVSSTPHVSKNIDDKNLYRLMTFNFSRDMRRITFSYKATLDSHDTMLLKDLNERTSDIVKYLYAYDHGKKLEVFERYLVKFALPQHLMSPSSVPDWSCGDITSTDGGDEIKTNFDVCCENVENMASIVDIMKCGWSKDDIIEWLNKPAYTDLEETS